MLTVIHFHVTVVCEGEILKSKALDVEYSLNHLLLRLISKQTNAKADDSNYLHNNKLLFTIWKTRVFQISAYTLED